MRCRSRSLTLFHRALRAPPVRSRPSCRYRTKAHSRLAPDRRTRARHSTVCLWCSFLDPFLRAASVTPSKPSSRKHSTCLLRATTSAGSPCEDFPRTAAALRAMRSPNTVEKDLVRLVLTVVELLRQLIERQALRSIDEGRLDEQEEERVGNTLMLLQDRMSRLRAQFGLAPRT